VSLLLVILTPFLGAALVAGVARRGRLYTARASGAVTLAALAWLLPLAPKPFAGKTVIQRFAWLPDAGLDLAFRLDGLGLLFALLILLIGLLVIVYARYYSVPERLHGVLLRFFAAVHGFHAGRGALREYYSVADVLGIDQSVLVPADQLLGRTQRGAQRRTQALAVTGFGGLVLLGGFVQALVRGQAVGLEEEVLGGILRIEAGSGHCTLLSTGIGCNYALRTTGSVGWFHVGDSIGTS